MAYRPVPHAPEATPIEAETGGGIQRPWAAWFNLVRDVIRKVDSFEATIDPAAIAANTSAEQTFTVTGLLVDHVVTVNKPTATAGIGIVGARVSAANTLAITFMNSTGGALNPGSETYSVVGVRK